MAIIDTDDEDLVLLVVARVTERHSAGHVHLDLRVVADKDVPQDAIMRLITDAGHQYLQEKTSGEVGLVVMSPRELSAFIQQHARREFGGNPFGAPARGPARGWG